MAKPNETIGRPFLLASILVLVICSCWCIFTPRPLLLREQLLAAIDSAETITVVEHSNRWDSVPRPGDLSQNDVVYRKATLTPDQVRKLKSTLPLVPDFDSKWVKVCSFETHHDIYFETKDHAPQVLQLCFMCGQIKWNDRITDLPPDWKTNLAAFVSSLGLHPNGPWRNEEGERISPESASHR